MNYINYLYLVGLFLLTPSLKAQNQKNIYDNRITVTQNNVLEERNDSLLIDLTLDASLLELSSCRSLTLTPILVGADSLRLTPVLLNGRNRHQVYKRSISLGETQPRDYYSVVRAYKKKEKVIHYRYALPFANWMNHAHLKLEENLCGCGNHTEAIRTDELYAVVPTTIIPQTDEPFQPLFMYVQPIAEKIKNRSELKDIYLNFPVNKIVIYPDYMNNASELNNAQEMIERINSDKNLSIQEVIVRGYASPEGSVPSNYKLSEGRAAALKNYLLPRLHTASLPMRSESGGEDWEGVIKLLETSTFNGHDTLLNAIRSCNRSDAAEMALRSLGNGVPYKTMLQDIYPKVRRVLCTVNYTAREFTVEESRTLIRTRPEQLSLHEMFQVADSYNEGSYEFNEAIYTAVRLYPEDETALVNAATVALTEGKTEQAVGYLAKIKQSNAAYENSYGLLLVQQKEYEKAASHFRKAIELGSEAGRHNLSELEKKHANKENK